MCVVCGCEFTFVWVCLCVVCTYVCVHVCVCGESFAHEWGRVDVLGVELNWLLHAILLVWPGEEIAFVPMQHKHVLLNIECHKCLHGNLQRTTSIGPGMNDIVGTGMPCLHAEVINCWSLSCCIWDCASNSVLLLATLAW